MHTINVMPNGTKNIRGWILGPAVKRLTELEAGTVCLDVSPQFEAQNLLRITRVGNRIVGPEKIAYGRYVSPIDGNSRRAPGDDEMAVWDFQLGKSITLFHVTREAAGTPASGTLNAQDSV